jgi:MgtC family
MEIAFKLIMAAFMGRLIGIERDRDKRRAGSRTNTLSTLRAACFGIIAFFYQRSFALVTKMKETHVSKRAADRCALTKKMTCDNIKQVRGEERRIRKCGFSSTTLRGCS